MFFFPGEVLIHVSRTARMLAMTTQEITSILFSFAHGRSQHHNVHAAILEMLPLCSARLHDFEPQDLSSVLLAVSKCFGYTEGHKLPAVQSLQVQEFSCAARLWIMPRIAIFSAQSLANLAAAFAALRENHDIFVAIASEVVPQTRELKSSVLLALLGELSLHPEPQCVMAARKLLLEAACRVEKFRRKEVRALSEVCSRLAGLPHSTLLSTIELQNYCCAFGAGEEQGKIVSDIRNYQHGTPTSAQDKVKKASVSSVPQVDRIPADDVCAYRLPPGLDTPGAKNKKLQQLGPAQDVMPEWVSPEKLQAPAVVESSLGLLPTPRSVISKKKPHEHRRNYRKSHSGQTRCGRGEISGVPTADEPRYISLNQLSSTLC